jgi:putative spermidine/putrescine transport system ATP-binding protein
MAMSDRIMVMNDGRIVESGTPLDLYRRPDDAFTASFLGQTNLLRLPINRSANTCSGVLPWGESVALEGTDTQTDSVLVSLRPEDLSLTPDPAGDGVVTAISFTGAQVNYSVQVATQTLRVAVSGAVGMLELGQKVRITAPLVLRALREQADPEESRP